MRAFLFLIVIGLGGAAILVWLGIWQVQRLAEKEDMIGQINAKIAGATQPLETALEPEFQRYAAVEVTGRFGSDHVRMLASRKQIGPVFRVIRPFDVPGFGRLLIDTGWQSEDQQVVPAPAGTVTLRGNLDAPNEADSFTPAPDLAGNMWFARDVPALAQHLGTQPVMVVLRDAPGVDLGVTPWPVDTGNIPNDHLQYAITWFSLAIIWLGMSLYFMRRARALRRD